MSRVAWFIRSSWSLLRVLGTVLAAIAVGLGLLASPAAAQAAPPSPPAPVEPAAWILADATTGAVLEARNERHAMAPASVTKLLTALVAVSELDDGATVQVSDRAAAMPARKLNMVPGHEWPLTDALHALLLSSANDVAVAIAETVAGDLDAFAARLDRAGRQLGLADTPVLQDPSGLDDADSVGGGNAISARDLAIIGRAVLAHDRLAPIVATREYSFLDPGGAPHRLINHNKLLRTYPGAIGMKTGYTRRAGHTLVAAAERGGRKLVTVVLRAPDPAGFSAALLERGFAGAMVPTGDVLPDVASLTGADGAAGQLAAGVPANGTTIAAVDSGTPFDAPLVRIPLLLVGTVGLLRGRVVLRQSRRRRRAQRYRTFQAHPAMAWGSPGFMAGPRLRPSAERRRAASRRP